MKPLMSVEKARERYPHGTYARYRLGGCRCSLCRRAVCEYENARAAAKRPPFEIRYSPSGNLWVVRSKGTGEIRHRAETKAEALALRDRENRGHAPPNELISTLAVQQHVASLRQHGVGIRTIAARAGVTRGILSEIINGDIRRTRRSTATRILAVTADAVQRGSRVRPDETIVLIERLVAAGYRRGWIAATLGNKQRALQLGKNGWLTLERALAVRALYLRLQRSNKALPQISSSGPIGVVEPVKTRRARGVTQVVTRPTYEHGTNACYEESKCRCASCQEAHAALTSAVNARPLLRYGIRKASNGWTVYDLKPKQVVISCCSRGDAIALRDRLNADEPLAAPLLYVDVALVRDRVRKMHDNGFSDSDIAAAAGVGDNTVHNARRGKSKRIRKVSAALLLALDESEIRSGNMYVDAAPSHDLLLRLTTAGFDKRWIATEIGLHGHAFSVVRRHIRLRHARALAALYSCLCERVGSLRALDAAIHQRSL